MRATTPSRYVAAVIPRAVWLHAATLAVAGLGFGVYTAYAQARGDATLWLLVICIALLALAQLQNRNGPNPRRANWWEWVASTLTFALVIGGWRLLDETDPSGPAGAPSSMRMVVVVTIAIPLTLMAWVGLRDARAMRLQPSD